MVFISFILSCSYLVYASDFHVVVDPGHGGHDRGAHSGPFNEADLTLNVSRHLEKLLLEDPDFQVTLTRRQNEFVSLEQRSRTADQAKGDVFISIHVNSSKDNKAQGKEVYFQNQLPADQESLFLANLENSGHGIKTDEEDDAPKSDLGAILHDLKRNHRILQSSKLSEFIHENWLAPTAERRRPIRQAPFHVISSVSMPSALVEIGYLSNAKDLERLKSPDYLKKVAEGLYLGLKDFKEFVDKKTRPHLN